jgi:hypothetical protein
MAKPGRPERKRTARSFRQLRRFHHGFNSNEVFGTNRGSRWRVSSSVTQQSLRATCSGSLLTANCRSWAGSRRDHFATSFFSRAYRKSHPAMLMVQSAQDLAADDIAGPLEAARDRGHPCSMTNECAWCCTTRFEKAHRTVLREVLYRHHPWFGRRVCIHGAVDKDGFVVFRCTLEESQADRALEVPAWMFDRTVMS